MFNITFLIQVKIIKENNKDCDSEIEIDVEDTDEETSESAEIHPQNSIKSTQQVITDVHYDNICTDEDKPTLKSEREITEKPSDTVDLSIFDESVTNELLCMSEPTSEVILDPCIITDLEKAIHREFFDGRPAKTPARYLKVNYVFRNSLMVSS